MVAHLVLALPDGRLERRSHRVLLACTYVAGLGLGLVLLTDRDHVLVWPVVLAWLMPLAVAPAANGRYRRASAHDRREMQWFGWAISVALEIALVAAALHVLTGWPGDVGIVALMASATLPLSLVAGTGQRLGARVDRLLAHTVSLTGLTLLIVAAYVVAVIAFGRKPDDSERTLLLLSMLAAAGAALAFQPARAWLSERANRLVYGERVAPDEALRTWGSRLTRAIPLDELLLQLVEALRASMQLTSAQVWTGTDGHLELAAAVPHVDRPPLTIGSKELTVVARAGPSGGTWTEVWLPQLASAYPRSMLRVAPIAHAGSLLGIIVCARPDDREPFDEESDQVLSELARQVGLALHNVQLDTALQASLDDLRQANDDLRASRTRVVVAGDEARRKLERNLHDGAQQHLVALAVKLRLARDSVGEDPAAAEAMIDEVRGNLQEAITELRSLAHGIFPPLLVSGGLPEALQATAARAAVRVTLELDGVGRHTGEVEAAVYFCCSEALQNAGKHAADATVTLRVTESAKALVWEVVDDGPGFDAAALGGGHGFINMEDRMGSVGGQLEVISAPGAGTTVRGSIPLETIA
jgi:signal transduction histidine kinase